MIIPVKAPMSVRFFNAASTLAVAGGSIACASNSEGNWSGSMLSAITHFGHFILVSYLY